MSSLHMIELWPQEAQLFHFLQGQGMNDAGDEDLGYGMHAWLTGNAPWGASGQRRRVQVSLGGTVQSAGEVDQTGLFVHACHPVHDPLSVS